MEKIELGKEEVHNNLLVDLIQDHSHATPLGDILSLSYSMEGCFNPGMLYVVDLYLLSCLVVASCTGT